MRIAISSLTYPLRNGVTNSINVTVDGLINAGHEVVIIAPKYNSAPARPEHRSVASSSVGRVLIRLFYGKDERMFGLRAKSEIEAIVEEFKPDLFWLHTVTWAPNQFEKIMLESGRPTLLTYHTLVEQYGRVYGGPIGAERMVERSREVANAVDQVITPSEVIADKLRGYGVTKPITVIPTGIPELSTTFTKAELASRFGFDAARPLLLYVGRISEEKNIAALLKMAQLLHQRSFLFTLLLVGPGDLDETRQKAEELGVGEFVKLTGALSADESRACYAAADLFVFASQSETQGLVIGEAMTAGTPVVALESPIQPEIYPETVAKVVKTPLTLARAVEELIGDTAERERLGSAGQRFVQENFSLATMTKKQLALLKHLVTETQLVH